MVLFALFLRNRIVLFALFLTKFRQTKKKKERTLKQRIR